jgi:hypothetical protein
MLRAICLTSKYGEMMSQMKKDTADMGTSVENSINNYIKE